MTHHLSRLALVAALLCPLVLSSTCAETDAIQLADPADAETSTDAEQPGVTDDEPSSPTPEPDQATALLTTIEHAAPNVAATLDLPVMEGPEIEPFVVHEWGTWTSVQGSDGRTLEGVHATEEELPRFVQGRADRFRSPSKSIEHLPEAVTQKLETPVIYFYADREHGPREVVVEVGFPEGIISEWYPDCTVFGPPIDSLDRIAEGSMRWDVELLREDGEMAEVEPDSVWAPSRRVPDAMQVRAGGRNERFIFYRGLGRFEVPVSVTQSEPGGPFRVHNASDDDLAAVFLIHVDDRGRGGSVQTLGALAAGSRLEATTEIGQRALDEHIDVAADAVAASLVDSGLYPDEARAMVDTWRHSYFATPGTRVLYVAPQSWADDLLPLAVQPAPDELVRTLVGRIDVLPVDEEQALLDEITGLLESREAAMAWDPEVLGRFAEPKLRRVQALSDDPRVDALCDDYLDKLGAPYMPRWIFEPWGR